AWAIEGRAGAALSVDRSLRRHLASRADPHVGFDALWMATTNLTYLDRRLWDDAGAVEAGPSVAMTIQRGAAVLRARVGGRRERRTDPLGVPPRSGYLAGGRGRGLCRRGRCGPPGGPGVASGEVVHDAVRRRGGSRGAAPGAGPRLDHASGGAARREPLGPGRRF